MTEELPGERAHGPASDFLGSLAPIDREAFHAVSVRRAFGRDEFVFRVSDAGSRVYVLESGRVKIFQPADTGRDVILWYCLPGDIFGLAEAAGGGGRTVSAQACDACRVLVVSQDAFRSFVAARPSAALLAIQVLSARLRGLSDVMVNLVADDVDTRIAKLILRLGMRYGRREGHVTRLDIPFTHQEIADMVGTTRQTVSSTLNRLKRQGVLTIETRRIQIESEELLSGLTHD
jgi:CRP-like cAMP-binding protein